MTALRQSQASGSQPTGARPLEVVNRPIAALKLAPKNPRHHNQRQVRQIARSIQAFGFNVPILVDAESNVIAGHGRVLACRELGWTEAPTIRLEHLTETQARAYMIADNRLTETSDWDDRLLAEQLRELSFLDLEFDLEATGFTMGEIDLRIEGLGNPVSNSDDPADALPSTLNLAISQVGDVWQLDRHRLRCGSALDPNSYALLMEGERAAMVFTDPPYNVRIDGNACGFGAVQYREFTMASGEMDEAEFTDFLSRCFRLLTRQSVDGAIHFVCMDWRHLGEIHAAGREVYSELKNLCVWTKHNAGLGSFYRSQHELVFVFRNGRGPHRNNVQLGQHGRHRTNVWSYPSPSTFGRSTEEGNLSALHPTVKPVQMVADAILDCSARGDIVLDSFVGSGTTLIAAARTGRRCFGIEIDPLYVDCAIRRWQAFTGGRARHVKTGRDFNDLAAERERDRPKALTPLACGTAAAQTHETLVQTRKEPNDD
jgi:DNA modification methylase